MSVFVLHVRPVSEDGSLKALIQAARDLGRIDGAALHHVSEVSREDGVRDTP